MRACGWMEVYLQSFLTSILDGGESSAPGPDNFTAWEEASKNVE